jgi:hypothetical protein
VASANDLLMQTLGELEQLGFSVTEVAELLEVDRSVLGGGASPRRVSGRTSRTVNGQLAASSGDDREHDDHVTG